MTARPRLTVVIALVASGFGLAACAAGPGDWGAVAFIAPAVLAATLAWGAGGRARAGAPMPCDGFEVKSCGNGFVHKHCCPAGAKCNFDFPRFLECGHGTCVVGADVGRCPSPAPFTTASPSDCGAGWELACVSGKVDKVCIAPVPTNYMGPPRNPPFRTCGDGRAATPKAPASSDEPKVGERCTTHTLAETCFPTRAELLPRSCLGGWQKVCLGGKLEDRCLPAGASAEQYPSLAHVTCGDGSCAVGSDKAACDR